VHRDLKPDNLFMTPDASMAGGERVKVLDFGIAKLVHHNLEGMHKTQTGTLMGTPTYMSPEQCRGAGEVDHRTDLYSLGCILFRILCGRIVFRAKGYGELIAAHIHLEPPAPRSIEPTIPLLLEEIILTLLAKDPNDRHQSAREVLAAIDGAVGVAAMANAPAWTTRRPTTNDETRVFAPNRQPEDLFETIDTAVRNHAPGPGRRSFTSAPSPALPRSPSALPRSPAAPKLGESFSVPNRRARSGVPPRAPSPAKNDATELAGKRSMGERHRGDGASTTLSSATGDASKPAPARSGRWLWAGVGLVLLALGGAGFVLLYFGHSVRVADPFAQKSAANTPPAAAEMVTVRIESTPPGAAVLDEDGARVGTTPYKTTRPRAPGEWEVSLTLFGYEPVQVSVPLHRSSTKRVALAMQVEDWEADDSDDSAALPPDSEDGGDASAAE
jgi:serine/threonine-protein kinase